MDDGLRNRIFSITSDEEFNDTAIEIFRYQVEENPVYKLFVSGLDINPESVNTVTEIPFLPIEFFKNHRIISGPYNHELFFESSGTTGSATSRHYLTDPEIYHESFLSGFRYFFGDPRDWMFAAMLPSYIERGNSSLVYMCEHLIRMSSDIRSRFWMKDSPSMPDTLRLASGEGKNAMLIGVSYALLDLAEKHSADLSGVTVVETGGMKGRRKEITREEMHRILKNGLNIETVHSEYGMTELLSQAWSKGSGLFRCPPWMKVFLRELNDPLSVIQNPGVTGGINVIDLANVNSCSFIATMDLGKHHPDGCFEVLGRFDNSDIRGCNLLVG
jgi:phenylacetate-coenzyme A ligase PaaK-like adenylate-forming protein